MLIAATGNGTDQRLLTEPKHEYCVLASDIHDTAFSFEALVDSGSKISIMKKSVFLQHFGNNEMKQQNVDVSYGGVNQSPLTIHGYVRIRIRIHLLPHDSFDVKFAIVPDSTMHYDALLGRDFMMRPGLLITFGLALHMAYSEPEVGVAQSDVCESTRNDQPDLSPIDYPFRRKLSRILKRFFVRRDHAPLQFRVSLKPRSKVGSWKAELPELSEEKRSNIRRALHELLARKVIRPSVSPHLNRIRVKGQGFCTDYSGLVGYPYEERRPINFYWLSSKSCFTTLSVKTDHENISLTEDSTKFTCFVTPDGRYEYTKVPYELSNFLTVYQKYLSVILKSLLGKNEVVLSANRIIIPTNGREENLLVLSKVLDLLATNNVKLRMHECRFLREELNFMNYRIKNNCVLPGTAMVEAIQSLRTPRCSEDLGKFLLLASRFGHLIASFQEIIIPLRETFNADFAWSENAHESFRLLRQSLMQTPVLSIYSSKAATEVYLSVDNREFWSVLMQRQSDGDFHPVAYFKRSFQPSEQGISERKLYRVVINYTLKKFHAYLQRKPFTIVSDRLIRDAGLKIKMKNYSFKIECRNFQLT